MPPKDQHLALSSGVGLAGLAVSNFWDYGSEAIGCFEREIIDSIVKPSKETAIHHFLHFFQDIYDEIRSLKNNIDDMKFVYDFIVRTLHELNLKPSLSEPNFEDCKDEYGHYECSCNEVINEWIRYVQDNNRKINDLIVHSAFQIIFQDRQFLKDFHLELSKFIEKEIETIRELHPEYVTQKNRLRRKPFPVWLKTAVFYRDKGTCVMCRCDLSNLIRTQNQIHIDHIVPLDLFGTNDASNMQLLCSSCNTSKGARSTETSTVNVPFWNL